MPQQHADERDHGPGLERQLPARLGAVEIEVAEGDDEGGEADHGANDVAAVRDDRGRHEEIQQSEDQQQPFDLGDAARESAQLFLFDVRLAGGRVRYLHVASIRLPGPSGAGSAAIPEASVIPARPGPGRRRA
jgi:hypothetical protein